MTEYRPFSHITIVASSLIDVWGIGCDSERQKKGREKTYPDAVRVVSEHLPRVVLKKRDMLTYKGGVSLLCHLLRVFMEKTDAIA